MQVRGVRSDEVGQEPTMLDRFASPAFRVSFLVLLVVVAVVFAFRTDGVGIDELRSAVAEAGALGPLLYVAGYALAATVLLPAAPFTIGAGLLFGPVLGTVTALAGATLGATGAFLVGRGLGRDAVDRFGGRRVAAVDGYITRRGFSALLLVRLVPLFPFNLINVVAGVTGLSLRDFVLATGVGIIPGTFLYAALGGTIDDPTSPAFLGALGGFLAITVIAGVTAKRLRTRPAPVQST